jgi:CelD/BcsL family acetyltransferase involved in cellulose biosynthesis
MFVATMLEGISTKLERINCKFVISNDLVTLRSRWKALLDSNTNPSFVHYYQWFSSYLESHEEESSNSFFLVVEFHGETIAICPLQYISKRMFGVCIKTWRIFWPGDMGLNDFIINKDFDGPGVLNILIQSLNKKKEKTWHMLELQNVDSSSDIFKSLKQEKISRLIGYYHHDSKYIACQTSYEKSVANVSGKFKRNNRRKLRKLEKIGAVSYSLVDSGIELDRAYQNFLKIEAANWKGRANTAISQNAKQLKFYGRLKDNFGETNQCLIYTLYLNDNPIAAQFMLHCGRTVYLLKIGYDEQYAPMGPGSILLDEAIRKFSQDANIDKISFVTGAKWNDNWAPHVSKVYNYYVFNTNLIGLLAYLFLKVKALGRMIKRKITDLR